MCEALLGALKGKGLQDMKQVVVCDIHAHRLNYLSNKFGVITTSSTAEAMMEADATIVCVKPQNVDALEKSITSPPKGLVLSIVAGVSLEHLRSVFKSNCIVRSMPNTPAMVLEGITVWIATPETPSHLRENARKLLGSLGEQIEVFEEHYIDMATAVSGSGPAVRSFLH